MKTFANAAFGDSETTAAQADLANRRPTKRIAMIQNLTTLVSLGSLLVLMYGVLQLITWPAPQECRMTYMFQYPQFTVGFSLKVAPFPHAHPVTDRGCSLCTRAAVLNLSRRKSMHALAGWPGSQH